MISFEYRIDRYHRATALIQINGVSCSPLGGVSTAFSKEAIPYWYNDVDGNGQVDADELKPENKYPAHTPRLLFQQARPPGLGRNPARCSR